MRTIQQEPEPHSFKNWLRAQKGSPQNLSYDNLPSEVKNDIKAALLQGQGHICAYTQRKITDVDSCHIEHIVPQNQQPEQALTYTNMLACFPTDGGDTRQGYGAPIKGGTAIDLGTNFVSPYTPACEKRFVFDQHGNVTSLPTDTAAQQTIKCLKLDHKHLIELRQRALAAHGLSIRTSAMRMHRHPAIKNAAQLLSAQQARALAAQVVLPDSKNHLEPFCTAIAQVAVAHAQREDARAQRIRNKH